MNILKRFNDEVRIQVYQQNRNASDSVDKSQRSEVMRAAKFEGNSFQRPHRNSGSEANISRGLEEAAFPYPGTMNGHLWLAAMAGKRLAINT